MLNPLYHLAVMQATESPRFEADIEAFLDRRHSPLDRPIRATRFAKMSGSTKRDLVVSLRDLDGMIRSTEADSKAELPWYKLAALGNVKTPLRPRPDGNGLTGGSLRHDANVVAVTGLEADYDEGKISAREACNRLKAAGVAALVYETPSSTPAHPRWRVLAPFSKELLPAARTRHMARLNGLFDGRLDPASFTLSQSFYGGNVRGRPKIRTGLVEGRCIDRASDLDATAKGKRPAATSTAVKARSAKVDEPALLQDIMSGSAYHDSMISLGGHWAATGIGYAEAIGRLESAFDAVPAKQRNTRWRERRASIRETLLYSYGRDAAKPKAKPLDPSDWFTDDDVPADHAAFDGLDDQSRELIGLPAKGRPSGLTFSTPDQCAATPSRGYVVKGLLAPGDVGCIFGAPGAGKSLLAPRVGFAVAQGQQVFGLRTKPGKVFYVAAEDEHGMRGRVTALRQRYGAADDFFVVGGVSSLSNNSPHLRQLRDAVKRERPALVIIDTLAMAFPGLEENDAKGMSGVVAVARLLARHGAAVILIHHDTKEGSSTPRGHSVLNGALDMALHVKPKDASGIIRGKLTKNRNGSCDLDIAFRIGTRDLGTDGDGDAITAALADELAPGSAPVAENLPKPEKAALDILSDMAGPGGPVTVKAWRRACIESHAVSGSEAVESRQRVMRRIVASLVRRRRIAIDDGNVRLTTTGRDRGEEFDDEDV